MARSDSVMASVDELRKHFFDDALELAAATGIFRVSAAMKTRLLSTSG
jgi:hypothetical protein